ncbi:unnamed protein product, partial [Iphiclides podalirius]
MKELITRVKGSERVPILLVGNKADLEHQREVSQAEGSSLAQMWGCPFVEASAKSRTNVNEMFAEIVREMNTARRGGYVAVSARRPPASSGRRWNTGAPCRPPSLDHWRPRRASYHVVNIFDTYHCPIKIGGVILKLLPRTANRACVWGEL